MDEFKKPVLPLDDPMWPYVAATIVIVISGTALVLGILLIRPGTDPLTLISAVGGLTVLGTGQALTFIKAHQALTGVNGITHERIEAAKAEGAIVGVAGEQNRVAVQKLATAEAAALVLVPKEVVKESIKT